MGRQPIGPYVYVDPFRPGRTVAKPSQKSALSGPKRPRVASYFPATVRLHGSKFQNSNGQPAQARLLPYSHSPAVLHGRSPLPHEEIPRRINDLWPPQMSIHLSVPLVRVTPSTTAGKVRRDRGRRHRGTRRQLTPTVAGRWLRKHRPGVRNQTAVNFRLPASRAPPLSPTRPSRYKSNGR